MATLGQLAGGVAHEIRNPLAVIRNNVYYFEATHGNGDEDTKAAIGEIDRAMDDSEHIIQELLDFARDPKPNENHFVLELALDEAMQRVVVPSNVQLNLSHEDVQVACCGDRGQIARIVGNLIRNAIDEMPEGGILMVSSSLANDSVTVVVADTGNGIAPENLERVFEPLHTGKAKGIGLGLAISKRYADLNAATLSVTSSMGNGARFQLVLKR